LKKEGFFISIKKSQAIYVYMPKELGKEGRSISRQKVERLGLTDEEGIAEFGLKWLDAIFKGYEAHDSSRNRRHRLRSQRALERKERRR
jgi:hypothetical protein